MSVLLYTNSQTGYYNIHVLYLCIIFIYVRSYSAYPKLANFSYYLVVSCMINNISNSNCCTRLSCRGYLYTVAECHICISHTQLCQLYILYF